MISIDIESWEESTKLYKIGLFLNDSPYNSFDITVIKIKTTLSMKKLVLILDLQGGKMFLFKSRESL